MFKKERGITLVALVVTIVVLLILAGVSISMVLGNNGIVTKAQASQAAQDKAYAKEQVLRLQLVLMMLLQQLVIAILWLEQLQIL